MKLKNVKFLLSFKKVLPCLCLKIIIGKVANRILEGSNSKQLKGAQKVSKERYGSSIEFIKVFG